ncbi:MAG: hypothetical protein HC892_05070 [Saprospiraceae bacterium]|nr:hypothetical protein [Saprospiraceae bacterium]
MSTSSNTLPSPSFVRNCKNYPAKLLLFGEHTLLKGSQGLAVPSAQFSGSWQQHLDGKLDTSLQQWHDYLLEEQQQGVY